MVKGLRLRPTRSSTARATSGCGGLEISTMRPRRRIGIEQVDGRQRGERADLARRDRGRRRRSPARCPCRRARSGTVTSCMPVPEAPMMPMSPRGTRLAKASGTPPMMAVPQSGPITRRPSVLRLALQRHFLGERHVVAEDHHVETRAQRLARLGGGVVAGHGDEREVASGLRAQRGAQGAGVPRTLCPSPRCAACRAAADAAASAAVAASAVSARTARTRSLAAAAFALGARAGRRRRGCACWRASPSSARRPARRAWRRSRATGASAPPSRGRSRAGRR